jgi:hypothetical protein
MAPLSQAAPLRRATGCHTNYAVNESATRNRHMTDAYKERKANNGQTLTRLGKWWERKPLILVRASIRCLGAVGS